MGKANHYQQNIDWQKDSPELNYNAQRAWLAPRVAPSLYQNGTIYHIQLSSKLTENFVW